MMTRVNALTPVQAIFWLIWKRQCWFFIADGVYLLIVAAVVTTLPHVLPGSVLTPAVKKTVAENLTMPCGLIVLHLLVAFTLAAGDEQKDQGFPAKLFTLPVTTGTLVFWPMLWGCAAVAAVWLFIAALILRASGIAVPLWWPATALAALVTFIQALAWLPLAQSSLRIFVALPFLGLIGGLIAVVAAYRPPELLMAALFVGILGLNCVAACRFVTLARRGDAYEWRGWERLLAWNLARRKPAEHPFRSAAHAQFWFECRCYAWMLPMYMVILLPTFGMFAVFEQRSDSAGLWKQLLTVLALPLLTATFLGGALGNVSFPFTAIRPLTSAAIVRSKFLMALASTLLANVPILMVVPLFFLSAHFRDSIANAVRNAGPGTAALVILLAAALPPVLTWKALAENQWIGLTGRKWLANVLGIGVGIVFGCAALLGVWAAFNPAIQELLWNLAPWTVGTLIVVKAALAVWVARTMLHTQLLSPLTLLMLLVAWTAIVAAGCALLAWFDPIATLPLGGMIAGVVLFIPFSRVVGTPLALEWNRHR